jgi:hypothetical protein
MSAQLPEAFWKTTYLAETPLGVLRLRIGLPDPGLCALLRDHGLSSWAYLTAWNPAGQILDRPLNDERLSRLRADLDGHIVYTGWGVGDVGEHMEQSLLVLGMNDVEARQLGRKYGQLAVVVGHPGGVPQLIPCDD